MNRCQPARTSEAVFFLFHFTLLSFVRYAALYSLFLSFCLLILVLFLDDGWHHAPLNFLNTVNFNTNRSVSTSNLNSTTYQETTMFSNSFPMLLFSLLSLFFLLLLIKPSVSLDSETSFSLSLEKAEETVNIAIDAIAFQWAIDKYPNFLRSVGSTRTDWDKLVDKFQQKILQATDPSNINTNTSTTSFIISFMGSSVTAGHDSPFKQSFPVLVGEKMAPILAVLGVQLETRNVAMGNNPCMPYDLCAQTFAGKDIDMIHWEQTYNCGFGDNQRVLEQFFRQTIMLPNHPLIVFTDSETPNWRKKDCPPNITDSYSLTPDEVTYLEIYHKQPSGISDIVTDTKLNKKSIHRKFGYLNHIIRKYKEVANVQLWDHSLYQQYKVN